MSTHPLALLNTTIATTDGAYTLRTVTLDEARALVAAHSERVSAIGHEATAQIASALLNVDVPVNRIQFAQAPGQTALCLKMRGRVPEGRVLTVEEMEAIGYEWRVLTRTE